MNPTAENGVVTHDSSSSSSLSSSSLSLTEDSMIVVTFNVLAPLMAKPSWFEECSSEVLNPVYRMQQIKKELDDLIRTGQQLSKPETNCDGYYNIPLVLHLQELQAQDEEMWKIFFADRGYTGVQVYRKGDKAVSMGIEPVHLGVGIFWPTDCFDVVHCQSQVFSEQIANRLCTASEKRQAILDRENHVAAHVVLHHKNTNTRLYFGCPHIVSVPKKPDLQLRQTHAFVQQAENTIQHFKVDGYVIAGDFNSLPPGKTFMDLEASRVIEFLLNKHIVPETLKQYNELYDSGTSIEHSLSLTSVVDYNEHPDVISTFTNTFSGLIDHMFYGGNVLCLKNENKDGFYPLMKVSDMHDEKIKSLPCEIYPSDHLPLVAIFEFNKQTL